MYRYLFLTILLSCLSLGTWGQTELADIVDLSGLPKQTEAKWVRYWFDDEDENAATTTDLSSTYEIEIAALAEGVHIVHFQIIDDQGIASIPASKIFIKPSNLPTTKKVRYWFDDDSNVMTTEDLGGMYELDVKNLPEGIHVVHYQSVDSKGDADIPVSRMFMKFGATVAAKATGIQYWFDENDALIKESDIENLTTTVDASGLALGEHVLHYQLKLSDGTLSPAASATFNTTQVLKGDANNDQKVNVADIVVIQIFIGDNTKPIHGANADADCNGVIDEKDVEDVRNIILGIKK